MGLKATLDSIEDLDEGIKALYKETGDGKFRLQVEGMDDFAALKTAIEKERASAADAKKALREMQERFDGIDPEGVKAILSKFADDEEKNLLKAGKLDEVWNKRTELMTAEHQKQLRTQQEETQRAVLAAEKLKSKALSAVILSAATKSGPHPSALEDIVARAHKVFSINDDGEAVAMNGEEVVFGKDGKTPLTPAEWMESIRESAPHFWPEPKGTGALGANSRNTTPKDLSQAKTREERIAVLNARLAAAES